eukprot:14670651-Ditylum_brightwellii.AAC.1
MSAIIAKTQRGMHVLQQYMERICYHTSQHVTWSVMFCINITDDMVKRTSQHNMERIYYHTSQHVSWIVMFWITIMERM